MIATMRVIFADLSTSRISRRKYRELYSGSIVRHLPSMPIRSRFSIGVGKSKLRAPAAGSAGLLHFLHVHHVR